ncbi:MAG: BON domain-containing protein [Ktedonobacteraceae bacterium]|nr:BON domain-containing protein [Ktedonobacteraceae bacterium]MBO0795527.1 BON domain-containing protein [Ktedonobacteraceae bacterium]
METSLQNATIAADELELADQEIEEAEHHVHLPSPSLWPLILSAAVLLDILALLSLPDSLVLAVLSAPLTLLGIMGWALQDPDGHDATPRREVPQAPAKDLRGRVQDALDRAVTVSSTAWSAHPIKADVDRDGTVTLHGKIELMAQRQEIEDAIWQVPGVRVVNNYIVAEDEILERANQRLENLLQKGKLDGATDLSILVENYILSLYGQVPTPAMKYTLEKEMLGIPGVRVVINHIGLNKEIPGNLGHTLNKVGGV